MFEEKTRTSVESGGAEALQVGQKVTLRTGWRGHQAVLAHVWPGYAAWLSLRGVEAAPSQG